MVHSVCPVGLGGRVHSQLVGQNATRHPTLHLRQALGTCASRQSRATAFTVTRCLSRGRQQQSVACSAAAANISLPSPDGGSIPFNPSPEGSAFLARIKGFLFYSFTLLLSVPLFVSMLVMTPFVLLFDKYRRSAQHFVNNVWAKASTTPFYGVKIEGAENLPPPDQPAVYVSNHQSFLDIFTLFHLNRSFKFVSKTSNFLIPIIGWSMFLTGHVRLNRMDKRSQLNCLKECGRLLGLGCSVLFFPEGTRTTDGKMAAFKKGAFSIAAKSKVPVVPVTLIGTGKLMPNGKEYMMYNGSVTMIVHPPVQPKKADDMLRETRDAIASRLPAAAVHPQLATKE
ncbi:hypothetical protein ABBQ32_006368 [Trebouxia sp. C0010 RCD-2024]